MDAKWIQLPVHGDDRGQLSLAEFGQQAPFDIKRVYWIYQTGVGLARGFGPRQMLLNRTFFDSIEKILNQIPTIRYAQRVALCLAVVT